MTNQEPDKLTVLLHQVHEEMRKHGETFWDMFSANESKKMRVFFQSLDSPDQHILECAAMADALLSAD